MTERFRVGGGSWSSEWKYLSRLHWKNVSLLTHFWNFALQYYLFQSAGRSRQIIAYAGSISCILLWRSIVNTYVWDMILTRSVPVTYLMRMDYWLDSLVLKTPSRFHVAFLWRYTICLFEVWGFLSSCHWGKNSIRVIEAF